MKKIYLIALFLGSVLGTKAQDTFSIVAIDAATGEIGSAGASCIANSKIISSIVLGKGALHTQSFYILGNKLNGESYMAEGLSPNEILNELKKNDVQGDSTRRQYGAVVLKDGGSAAAYTGDSCLDFKGHIVGQTYAIQGNILIGKHVLDSMEARFLREKGPLAYKLMAALQGANIPGADSRCLPNNKPAISAFIRVAKATDSDELYLDLNVSNTSSTKNPIDSLQKQFAAFFAAASVTTKRAIIQTTVFPNPATNRITVQYYSADNTNAALSITDILGKTVYVAALPYGNEHSIDISTFTKGMYFYTLQTNSGKASGKFMVE